MFIIARDKKMRTVTNFYLANRGVADVLLLLSPAVIHAEVATSSLSCMVAIGFLYVTFFASTMFVTLIAVERYLAICHPIKHRLMNSKRRSVTLTTLLWLFVAILTALIIPAYSKTDKTCIIWPSRPIYENYPNVLFSCGEADI